MESQQQQQYRTQQDGRTVQPILRAANQNEVTGGNRKSIILGRGAAALSNSKMNDVHQVAAKQVQLQELDMVERQKAADMVTAFSEQTSNIQKNSNIGLVIDQRHKKTSSAKPHKFVEKMDDESGEQDQHQDKQDME